MKYTMIYNACIVVSCMIEIYFALDFYKAFHTLRYVFQKKQVQFLCYCGFVIINVMVNLQHNNMLNIICVAILYFVMVLILFKGKIMSRLLHWIIVIFLGFSAEFIFSLIQSLPFNVPTNEIFDNEFFMISSILAVKMIYFILLSVVKQFSKFSTEKLEMDLFGNYIIIPIATLGVMFAIPYVRVGGRENSIMDFILLVFYLVLLLGNVRLFYIFTKYSQMKEQQMLQEVSKIKYEEKKQHYDKMGRLDEKYRELIHDIKYYLRQIGIYADKNQLEDIKRTLLDLNIEFSKNEEQVVCSNAFLNSVLLEFKERACRENITVELFVEAGFNIEYMKEMDMVVVLGNLCDNALEAVRKCEQGMICIDLFMQNKGALSVIRITNHYSGHILQDGERILSTKREEGIHGIGIKNVQSIVERYEGYMQQEHSDNVYETTILIPVR